MDPLNILMALLGLYAVACGALAYAGYALHVAVATATAIIALRWHTHRRSPGPSGFSKFDSAEYVCARAGRDLSGKVVIVTGSTSGIGEHTALTLAKHGAHVFVVGRSAAKIEASRNKILKECGGREDMISTLLIDLGDLSSVRRAAAEFLALSLPLHVLVCNAGIMAVEEGRTVDGFERQVGTNHLGHFLFVELLTPRLRESRPSRVVVLSSSAHRMGQAHFFSDANKRLCTTPYDKWVAYGNAKLCNMMFAREYNRRHEKDGVVAVSVHPGGIFTGLQGNVELSLMIKWLIVSPFFFKTIPQGAATSVLCAVTDKLIPGAFYEDSNPSLPYPEVREIALSDEKCAWLYDRSAELVAAN